MRPALELIDLRCVRGAQVLFDGLNATVEAGGLLRVEGRNGAGKTTLLRMVCGLAMPDDGEVRWQGRRIDAGTREAFHAVLVYIGHAPALKDELSALENLQAASGLAGAAASERSLRAALAQAGLGGRAHVPARALSQGQRKRAALARLALGAAAPLWVLDEPFDALDVDAGRWLTGLIAAQLARGGVVVLTSHQPVAIDAQTAPSVVTLGQAAHADRSAACA